MKIAISCPAGKVDESKLGRGLEYFKNLGHDVVVGKTCSQEEYWTAGSAELRAAELQSFWIDDSVDVLWAARGGFGCAHLLELLDWDEMRKHQKILCGHSDLSILHLAFKAKGLQRTVSAAMPAVEFADDNLDSLTVDTTFEALRSEGLELSCFQECSVVKEGVVNGEVMPVTLSVLCSLAGTEFMPDLSGAALVLEDVNENPYRLDAYLNQLKLCGLLGKLGALVFGDFKNCGSDDELTYLYNKYAGLIQGPVLKGLPFGHCLPRLSLPVGAKLSLKASKSAVLA